MATRPQQYTVKKQNWWTDAFKTSVEFTKKCMKRQDNL